MATISRLSLLIALSILVVACSFGQNQTPSPSPAAASQPVVAGPTLAPSATAAPSASPSVSVGPPTPTPGPSFLVYVVARGDSLTSIARRFKTTALSISFWNRDRYPSLDPDGKSYQPNKIDIGWKLSILPNITAEEAPAPSGHSTPVPLSSGSRPPAPTPLPDGSSLLISNGPRDANAVALTFDLGGEIAPTIDVAKWLVANDVRATIFASGSAASSDAGRQIMAVIAAHPDLFGIGNMAWDLQDLAGATPEAIRDQLQRAEGAVFSATGRSTKPLFRPPFGAQDADVRAAVGGAGWSYMVMWDVDTVDWKATDQGGPTADDIVAKVLARAQGGSIVLLHLGGPNTLAALPRIVDGLRARGLEPVTLADMLGL